MNSNETFTVGHSIENTFVVIPEFENALPQLGHGTEEIVGPGSRKDSCGRNILSWIGAFAG